MNGVEICGKKIKTKGPKKLDKFSPPSSPTEKKDVRSLTDCYYFMQHGECTPKPGQVS